MQMFRLAHDGMICFCFFEKYILVLFGCKYLVVYKSRGGIFGVACEFKPSLNSSGIT